MLTEILLGVAMFSGVVLALVIVLLFAKKQLVASGNVKIVVNGDEAGALNVGPGSTILNTLSDNKIFIPSACGGGGTCGQCKVKVSEGGGDMLPTEATHISRGEAKECVRLSCQVKVKQDMKVEVPEECFSVKKLECEVVSNSNVATFIKEFKLQLPEGEALNAEPGGYIQIDIPKYDFDFSEFDVEDEYRSDWDQFKLWDVHAHNDEPLYRAYSMANYPAEGNIVMLNVRIATAPPGSVGIPPGLGSSFIFNCKPGDKVTVSGPYGEFFINHETEREMVYVGGGAGMAPLRSHLLHLFKVLKTGRKVSFWYGARSKREIFYQEDFDAIAEEFPNFSWQVALSDALPEDNWTGLTGFIHNVVHDEYLSKHEAPEDVEYYMCGPPMMNKAVLGMLDTLGVEKENIRLDEF